MGNTADDRLNERSRPNAEQEVEFPRFLIHFGEGFREQKFISLNEIEALYKSNTPFVPDERIVLLKDFLVRAMTEEEARTFGITPKFVVQRGNCV